MIHRIDGTLKPENLSDCRQIRNDFERVNNQCKGCSLYNLLPRSQINWDSSYNYGVDGNSSQYHCILYMSFIAIEQNYDHAQNQKKYLLG